MTHLAEAPVDSRRKRVGGWLVIIVVIAAIGLVGAVLASSLQWNQRDVLDPESAGPDGTRALVALLADRGVDVSVVRSREQALQVLAARDATLVMADSAYLSDDAFAALTDAATDVVIINATGRSARVLFPGAELGGYGSTAAVAPACDLPAAQRAGAIVAGALLTVPDGATGCYPSGDGAALLSAARGAGRVAVIDGSELLTNARLADDGNAALGVNLTGALPDAVWYVAGIGDSDLTDADPSLGELTPGWVSPVIIVLLCTGIAAAVWRGRRFGPLVAENLPVTVRAAETTEGRARLYARSRDTVHAADQVRIGALGRMGRLQGLGPAATATEISDATALRLNADPAMIRGILIDETPRTDGELVVLGDRIRDLEAALRAAVRP